MKKLLLLLLLIPTLASAQVNGTIQKTASSGTVRGSFGSLGLDTLPRLTGILLNGKPLVYNSTTNKYTTTSLGVSGIDTTTIRTVANSRTLAQTQTALDGKVTLSPGAAQTGFINMTGNITSGGTVVGSAYSFLSGVTLATNSAGVNYLYSGTNAFVVTKNDGSTSLLTVNNTTGGATHAGIIPAAVATAGTAAGDILTVTGAKGGNTTGTTGQIAGKGSNVILLGGAGGDAPAGSTNGTGGDITLSAGSAGAGLGTAGVNGSIFAKVGGVTKLTVTDNLITSDVGVTAPIFTGPLTGNATSAGLVAISNDNTTNATVYPTWVTSISGNQGPTTSSTKLTFNPSTGALSSTSFIGPLNGNANSATLVAISNDNATNAVVYPLWATSVTGNQGPTASSTKLTFNPSTGNVTATGFTGALTGNSSSATVLQTARNINGVAFNGSADITVTSAAGTLTGTTLAANVVTSSLTSVGTLANLTVTNPITGSITGNAGTITGQANSATIAATAANTASTIVQRDASGNFVAGTITANLTGTASNVTTNANLTGPITSVGNATSVASQTGTGSTFVMNTSPTLTTPAITGPVVLTGNATSAARFTVTGNDANGATLFLNSTSTNGRNWGLYSNGIDVVGELAFYNVTNAVTALKFSPTGIMTLPVTPTTSAGTYDILTRNTSTGVVERVASTSMSRQLEEWVVDATNSGTAETDLYTFSVPANTLVNNGDKLAFHISGLYGATANSKTLKITFVGGFSPVVSTGNGTHWTITGWLIKTSATTYRIAVDKADGSTSGVITGTGSTVDFTIANTFKLSATGGATGDITAYSGYLEFKPAGL